MKKMFLVAASVIIPFMATFAQDYYRADFPNATNVHFARVKNLTEVSFTQDKDKMTAYYDTREQLVGTIHKESFADLPENAQKEIRNKYRGYSTANVVKYNDNQSDDTELILYGVSFDDADNYFVELKNDSKTIVLKVDLTGWVEAL